MEIFEENGVRPSSERRFARCHPVNRLRLGWRPDFWLDPDSPRSPLVDGLANGTALRGRTLLRSTVRILWHVFDYQ